MRFQTLRIARYSLEEMWVRLPLPSCDDTVGRAIPMQQKHSQRRRVAAIESQLEDLKDEKDDVLYEMDCLAMKSVMRNRKKIDRLQGQYERLRAQIQALEWVLGAERTIGR